MLLLMSIQLVRLAEPTWTSWSAWAPTLRTSTRSSPWCTTTSWWALCAAAVAAAAIPQACRWGLTLRPLLAQQLRPAVECPAPCALDPQLLRLAVGSDLHAALLLSLVPAAPPHQWRVQAHRLFRDGCHAHHAGAVWQVPGVSGEAALGECLLLVSSWQPPRCCLPSSWNRR